MPVPAGHSVRFYPGYSKIPEGFGVHGMGVAFYFRGEEGAVQFKFNTGWIPALPRPVGWETPYRHSRKELLDMFPMGTDLGYHSPVPKYEDQPVMSDGCDVLGGICYYDGSGLNAEALLTTLIYDGDDAVREALEAYYRRTFLKED